MKKITLCLMAVLSCMFLFGCDKIELTDEEEAAYVEYAVNAVINHDNNYMTKLGHYVEPEVEEESVWISDEDVENDTDKNEDVENEGSVSGEESDSDSGSESTLAVPMTEALGVPGLEASIKNAKEYSSYPEYSGDDIGFAITAIEGNKLLVVEIELKNTSDNTIKLDTSKGYTFKGIINGAVKTNAQVTFLLNALNMSEHNIKAGQKKDVVLVYEVNKSKIEKIEEVVVSVGRGDETFNVKVK